MAQITIEKSTVQQPDIELELELVTQTIVVNNNGLYDVVNCK